MKEFLLFAVLIGIWLPGSAGAQDKVLVEKLSLKVVDAYEPNASVLGEFRIPDSKRDRLPAPRLGEHSRAILAEIGMDSDEIDALLARKVVAER